MRVPQLQGESSPPPRGASICSRPARARLRLDLFRGLALWLIFIDHLPSNILTWFTIRNYGFTDATEIFIFISGYTAAFVYGRAMRERGFVVSTARILAASADLRRACFPVHDLHGGNLLRRHQFREPALRAKKWGFSTSSGSPT